MQCELIDDVQSAGSVHQIEYPENLEIASPTYLELHHCKSSYASENPFLDPPRSPPQKQSIVEEDPMTLVH